MFKKSLNNNFNILKHKMYKGVNLLNSKATNFSRYINWVISNLFSEEELKKGVVILKYSHKSDRTLLDPERVDILKRKFKFILLIIFLITLCGCVCFFFSNL